MAQGIGVIYSFRNILPVSLKISIMNSPAHMEIGLETPITNFYMKKRTIRFLAEKPSSVSLDNSIIRNFESSFFSSKSQPDVKRCAAKFKYKNLLWNN